MNYGTIKRTSVGSILFFSKYSYYRVSSKKLSNLINSTLWRRIMPWCLLHTEGTRICSWTDYRRALDECSVGKKKVLVYWRSLTAQPYLTDDGHNSLMDYQPQVTGEGYNCKILCWSRGLCPHPSISIILAIVIRCSSGHRSRHSVPAPYITPDGRQ